MNALFINFNAIMILSYVRFLSLHLIGDFTLEGQQIESRRIETDADGRTAIEMVFIPSVRNHIAAVHIAGEHRHLIRPRDVGFSMGAALSPIKVAGYDQIVSINFIFGNRHLTRIGDVGKPGALADVGRE